MDVVGTKCLYFRIVYVTHHLYKPFMSKLVCVVTSVTKVILGEAAIPQYY